MKTDKIKKKGITVCISTEAHAKIRDEAYKANPRRNIREHINITNKLEKSL